LKCFALLFLYLLQGYKQSTVIRGFLLMLFNIPPTSPLPLPTGKGVRGMGLVRV